MPRDLSSPDIQVGYDREGRVRQLCHPFDTTGSASARRSPDAPPPGAEALQALAEAFLEESAGAFGITALRQAKEGFASDLHCVKVKRAVGNAAAVSFDQYVDDMPVWRAGVTVRIDAGRMRVTGAHNAAHLDIRLHRCGAEAPYVPAGITADVLQVLLRLDAKPVLDPDARPRLLVYQFRRDNRLGPPTSQAAPFPLDAAAPRSFAGGALPALPPEVEKRDGMHCVVTEVLFTLPIKGWGDVNCRTFLDPDTGAVLYLRALVSCAVAPGARALVFPRDPASFPAPANGPVPNPGWPVSDLDRFRGEVDLQGLDDPDGSNLRHLSGEFIRLDNLEQPASPMPAEGAPFRFAYSCGSEDFAAASAYHHCDGAFRMVQSLGIDVRTYFSNTTFPVVVDPHAFGQGVNAQAVGRANGRGVAQFMFGSASQGSTFGIAADPRVVLHEFGHAVLWEHIGSPVFPFAHSLGDSLAAILCAPTSEAREWGNTYPFLGHLTGFQRRHDRRVEDGWGWFGNHYDREYGGEQVLSSTLFRLYCAAGGGSDHLPDRVAASRYVLYLLLAAIAMLDVTPQRPQVLVDAMIEADAMTDVFEGFVGGSLGKAIRWAFEQQGLYRPPGGPLVSLAPGAPPPVDVYIDDGRQGQYQYVEDLLSPPGLWNRLADDGDRVHQSPVANVANFACVEVCNRGTTAATGVAVRVFRTSHAGQRHWGPDWSEVPGGPWPAQAAIAPGGSEVIGPIEWTPEAADDHLLVCASAPGDPCNLLEAKPVGHPVDCFVRLDNNVAQRRS